MNKLAELCVKRPVLAAVIVLALVVVGVVDRTRVGAAGEVGAARPLPVVVLQREQPRAHSLRGDPIAGAPPDLLGLREEVALDLPAQRRIGVEQPAHEFRIVGHALSLGAPPGHDTPSRQIPDDAQRNEGPLPRRVVHTRGEGGGVGSRSGREQKGSGAGGVGRDAGVVTRGGAARG